MRYIKILISIQNLSMQGNTSNSNSLFFSNFSQLNRLHPAFQSSIKASCPSIQFPFMDCKFPILSMTGNHSDKLKPLIKEENCSIESETISTDRIKQEESIKLEGDNFRPQVKQEVFEKKEEIIEMINNDYQKLLPHPHKAQIKQILLYILNNIGRVKESDLEQEKMTYAYDPILVELFETILYRYSSTFKTKDEILKYITRKAFTTIRNNYRQKKATKAGEMSEALCKRYFKASPKEIKKLGIDIDHRENFLQVLFPYRKNCKNKARYKDLISKLGTSQEFYEDYSAFLANFTGIMQHEKEKKINVFVSFLCDCVKRRQVKEILQYKRIPWLDTWITLAEITAQEINVALKVRVSNQANKTKCQKKENTIVDLNSKQ